MVGRPETRLQNDILSSSTLTCVQALTQNKSKTEFWLNVLGSQWPSSRDIVSSHADLQITDLHVMYKIIDAVCVYISAQLIG